MQTSGRAYSGTIHSSGEGHGATDVVGPFPSPAEAWNALHCEHQERYHLIGQPISDTDPAFAAMEDCRERDVVGLPVVADDPTGPVGRKVTYLIAEDTGSH